MIIPVIGRPIYIVFIILFIHYIGFSQLPKTVLYELNIEEPLSNVWKIKTIKYLSNLNPLGYNNQVFHLSENEFLCSIKFPNSNNTDIYRFNIFEGSYSNLSNSSSSEYSPRLYPLDPNYYTTVSVPQNDSNIQDLILHSFTNSIETKKLLANHGKVGYYRYINNNSWLCFLVDSIHLFAICKEQPISKKVFASGIGRCFEVLNENEAIFVHKTNSEDWFLKSYNFQTERISNLIKMPNKSEDFIILSNGNVVCSYNSKLLLYKKGASEWSTLADLEQYNIKKVNRLSMWGRSLILVSLIEE